MRTIWLLSLCFILTSCASKFMVNDSVIKMSQGLNQEQALKVLRFQLKKSEDQAGICQVITNISYNPSRFVRLDKNANLFVTGIITKMFKGYQKVYIRLNLKTIKEIRIRAPEFNSEAQFDCPYEAGEISMVIKARNFDYGSFVIVRLSRSNLDDMLAALLALSPEAKLKSGIGM